MYIVTRKEAIAAEHTLDPALLEKISEADRRWFKKHPDRNYQIRKPMNGEPSDGCMIVEQVEPGFRIRRSIHTYGVFPPNNDKALGCILELLTNGWGAVVFGDEVMAFDELPNMGGSLQ